MRPDRVEIYSVTLTVTGEDENEAASTQGQCRLFEDVDGDGAFDPAVDRNQSTFNLDSQPAGSWQFGPLMGGFQAGEPAWPPG